MTDEKEKGLRYFEDTMDPGRTRRLTEKALEEKLQKNIALRRRKLGALTSKINELEKMMSDTQNVHKVKDVMENDFPLSLNELYCLNKEVASLLPEDEKTFDQEQWFESKMASIKEFMKATKT